MSSYSHNYKALKCKSDQEQAIMERISEHQRLRKKKRGNSLDYLRNEASTKAKSCDIDDLIEDVEMLDVTGGIKGARHKWINLFWSQNLRDNMTAATRTMNFLRRQNEQQSSLVSEFKMIPRLFELLLNAQASSIRESYLLQSLKVSPTRLQNILSAHIFSSR